MNKREYQHQFENTLLFGVEGLETGEGALQRTKRGIYQNPHIEAAYLGYAMARRSDREQLKRYAPDRHIGTGMLTELRGELGYDVPEETVRVVLRLAGGWPA